MNTNRLLKILAIVTVIGAYIMIVLGVLVTTTGSGQGCGNSWPFCHGQIIPGTLTVKGLTEYSHRIMSSLDGFLVLILTVWSWFAYRRDRLIKLYAFLSLLFIVIQGVLGAVTVSYEGTFAMNWLLSIHFGLSLIAFASVILLTTRLFELGRLPQGQSTRSFVPALGLQVFLWVLTVYTYLVVYTGAYVEHTGAVIGCGYQFPMCGSTYGPDFFSLAGIQLLHRYAAGLLLLGALVLLIAVLRRYRHVRALVVGAWWSMILVTLQALVGVMNVFTTGQMVPALTHATLVSVFFAVLCYLCAQVGWPGHREALPVPSEEHAPPVEPVSSRG